MLKRFNKTTRTGQPVRGSGWPLPFLWLGLSGALFPLAVSATHEHPHMYHLTRDCSLTIEGTATLHDWACSTTDFKGHIFIPVDLEQIQAFFVGLEQGKAPTTASLHEWTRLADGMVRAGFRANIDALKCGKPGMEHDLQNALKHEKNPEIIYEFIHLAGISVLQAHGHRKDCIVLHTEGHLELAGVIRKVVMDVHVTRQNGREFKIVATTDMNMTDFEVDPPTALMGLIKAHDPVEITIRAVLN